MKRVLIPMIYCIFIWAQTDAASEVHGLGLLYEDLSKVPWFVETKYDPMRMDPPDTVMHQANMPPVGNQGGQGSCTAWGIGYYYKTYQEWCERGWSLTDQNHQCSPAFMYNLINGGQDGGSYASDGCKVLVDHGCAPYSNFPYNQGNCTNWPTESAWVNALPFRSQQAYFINCGNDAGVLAIKQHLADGDNAVLGINVYSNFDNINNFDTTYCVADKYGTNRGGHMVCIVGYNDNKVTNDGPGAFRLVNSWGTGWGNQGYWWMSYVAVKNADLSHQQVCYTSDRIRYAPTITVRYKVTHSKREWVKDFVGIGASGSPLWSKSYFNWSIAPAVAHAFPNNNIVLDFSDGINFYDAYDTNSIFVGCRDILTDGQTGTIQYYAGLNNEWGEFSPSFETPKTMPDNGIAYVNLTLPTQKMPWQRFHCRPASTGFTALIGDLDSVALLWNCETSGNIESSPCLGDVNNDDNLEVVVGSNNGNIYALNNLTGDSLWVYRTSSSITSSPVLGDVDGDGKLEVIVGTQNGKVYVLDGEDGDSLWIYATGNSVKSSPVLGDVDDDGELEIIVGSLDQKLYALNGENGTLRWSYTTTGAIESSPALGDIDGDGKLEVAFGCQNNKIYVLNGKYGDSLWTYTTANSITSSPCLGDIDGDGKLEVVVGSFDQKVYALNGENGGLLWSYTTGGAIKSSPALGDVDGDGGLDVVVGSNNGKIYALDGEDGDSLWTYLTGDDVVSSPGIGDIDDDDKLEIVVGSYDHKVYALDGENGGLLWSYTTGDSIHSSPALADIDKDGKLEVVIGADDNKIYALNGIQTGIKEIVQFGANPKILLSPNHPNPVTVKTTIQYFIAQAGDVKLRVFDITGREITVLVNDHAQPGYYQILWDISKITEQSIPNGIYFYRLEAGKVSATNKMIVCR